jgi:hypothetical protein
MSTPSNSQEYKITEATIFAERFAEEYNLTSYVGEISFFEDLNRPYVTGQIVIMDDIGVFDEIKLRGSEQIRLKIESNPQGTSDANLEGLKIEMIMNIVSIVQAAKVGERSEVYHLNLISPHAYRDANKKISRSSSKNNHTIHLSSGVGRVVVVSRHHLNWFSDILLANDLRPSGRQR